MKLKSSIQKSAVCLLAALMFVVPTCAQPAQQLPVLGIDHAMEMGINCDDKLAQYSRKIDIYATQKGDYEDIASLQFQNCNIYIDQYTTAKKYRKDVIRKQVLDSYQNLILLQEKLKLETDQIALQEKLNKQFEIKLKKGMCDQLTYDKQVQKLKDLKDQQEKDTKSLTNLKSSFLKLTNINVDNYTLTPDYTYTPFDIKDTITGYASGTATELIKYQKQLAQLADSKFWETIYSSGPNGTGPTYSSYVEKKINVADALALVDTNYKAYKAAIESMYAVASNSLNDVQIKEAAYQSAEKDMKALDIKYNAGYISALEYEKQKVDIEAAKIDFLNAVYTYNVNKFQLEKPWSMGDFGY